MMNEEHSTLIIKLFWEIEKKKNEKIQKYPYLVLTDELATRRKGEKQPNNQSQEIGGIL
jgi:hypothetical protein